MSGSQRMVARAAGVVALMSGLCGSAMAAPPWIDAVGDRTIVCVSPSADARVREAADRVLQAVKAARPDAKLHDPDQLALDYDTLGTNHVIAVGQWPDNQVLRMTWGFWASTKAQREWQAKGESIATELMDLWEKDIPPQEWRWKHEFFAFGYGDFDGPDVGYVQTVRNPFPILLRTVPGQKTYDASIIRISDKFPQNQMYFVVHLTGTGPEGVAKAADAFVSAGLLNGVVPGKAAPPADWSLECLGAAQLAVDLPPFAPLRDLPAGVRYLGQQMPGSHLYGGFCQAAGARPSRCWRLKYKLDDGFVLYDSYPTNRASANELFIAQMASGAEAERTASKLRETMEREPERDRSGAAPKPPEGLRVATRDNFVLMHSFQAPEGDALLRKAVGK